MADAPEQKQRVGGEEQVEEEEEEQEQPEEDEEEEDEDEASEGSVDSTEGSPRMTLAARRALRALKSLGASVDPDDDSPNMIVYRKVGDAWNNQSQPIREAHAIVNAAYAWKEPLIELHSPHVHMNRGCVINTMIAFQSTKYFNCMANYIMLL